MRPGDHSRSAKAKQLDFGIGDTFVLVDQRVHAEESVPERLDFPCNYNVLQFVCALSRQ
jgi:hypothetical protein